MSKTVTDRPAGSRPNEEPGFDEGRAREEAWRCLQCFDAPCATRCPAEIAIPRFIRMIQSGNYRGAAEVVRTANPLASSCGLACPDEQLCASFCLRAQIDRPIEIRRLHRFATDFERTAGPRRPVTPESTQGRVAIVGSGPAGLACAAELRRQGIGAVIFESRDRAGGVLTSTIPIYRFPESTVKSDLACAIGPDRESGIEWRFGRPVRDIAPLAGSFGAVFLAPGLSGTSPAIPNAGLRGVTTADAFLARCRATRYRLAVGPSIIVIGGGNVAIDAAIAAVECGRRRDKSVDVEIVYRRGAAEMPAWKREIEEARRLGVGFRFHTMPDSFIGPEGRLQGLLVRRAEPGPPDSSGRPRPVPVPGSDAMIPCDTAVLATGMQIDRDVAAALPRTREGRIRIDRRTGLVTGNIYAGGDATGTEMTIVAAVRDGKRAARAIAAAMGRPRR